MPNNYFQFKQFTVYQDACAMKVCTDACLFGAWVVAGLGQRPQPAQQVLDIGGGTGLLSLMVAQETNATIHTVEIDIAAAEQATANFAGSPWANRLSVHQTAIQQFTSSLQYDVIISNPPFFENDLKSASNKRNLALHSEALSLDELFKNVDRLLQPEGVFALLLPWHRHKEAIAIATQSGLHMTAMASIQQTPAHNNFRVMLLFERITQHSFTQEQLVIRDADNLYTQEFSRLLKNFYLHL
ncbi:tRNA1Val (adenine37-N6)-methyltransferase [Filimonas lacunae]|uniref:tRNA1(Val) (adenine(37)-N6)-methyltransferase n=1 Tax=Filimonas lacunae TaxID=477680 RepID=A0A173MA37_9BACT|nr:methyltransferase [Filimonas lacunae]BAV04405.1 tRNA (adenine37-N(6))-methyltransferase [Filimonas lacunae]SIT31318.1 tRNA1Val (adenine37-N6)-methyltransferase [Filimonas lacunae]